MMTMVTSIKISRQQLCDDCLSTTAVISDVKSISSYNWVEAPRESPTIVVPGSPARWTALQIPKRLEKDTGLVYIAQNAARHPDSPLEPLFRAVYESEPTFDISVIDVVTDRNNVRKLLSFIAPSVDTNRKKSFTIDIEVIKDTVLFCRAETATCEIIGPYEFKGFGHQFEKTHTTDQIKGSTGHHRIVSYHFGGLRFLLRHEVDGYVGEAIKPPAPPQNTTDLSDILGSLSLGPPTNGKSADKPASKLIVRNGGQVIPINETLEIKTRAQGRPYNFQELGPQLWISQTPNLVRSYHYRGTFQPPKAEDVSGLLKSWETDNENNLKQLVTLIKKIVDAAKNCDGKACLKYDVAQDVLVISKVERSPMLPSDLYAKWDKPEKSTSCTIDDDVDLSSPIVQPTPIETKSEIKDTKGRVTDSLAATKNVSE